jgi:transposase-like protein
LHSTNPIESLFSRVRACEKNIKRYRNSRMAQRWLASVLEKFPKVVDGGGWEKGILRGTKKPAAITRWRHNPQDTYGTEECS